MVSRRTSATDLRAAATAGQAGFTLLEMLTVMVLLGLASAIALPRLDRWHASMVTRAQLGSIDEALRGAMFAAGAGRRDLLLDRGSFEPAGQAAGPDARDARRVRLALPPGWQVIEIDDAVFLGNGLCRAGKAVLRSTSGAQVHVHVEGPACAIRTQVDLPDSRSR